MKRVAVTGATSMIGAALIEECVKNEIEVIAFVRCGSQKLNRLPDSPLVHLVEAELDELRDVAQEPDYPEAGNALSVIEPSLFRDRGQVQASEDSELSGACSALTNANTLLQADVFYHFGWATGHANRGNVRLQADNIQYTLDAVDLAERLGCSRFIGAGSQAEYGLADEPLTAETPAWPLTPYGIAKLAAGNLSRVACEQKGIEHIWVRVLSIYGAYDKPNTLISQLVQHALRGEPMELSGCEQTWDYLYVSDAGRAFLETGRRGVAGKTYVLGSGDGRRLKSYVDELTAAVNLDYQPQFGKKPYGPAQPMYLQADIAELTEDTGWRPLVSFAEGIREILRQSN